MFNKHCVKTYSVKTSTFLFNSLKTLFRFYLFQIKSKTFSCCNKFSFIFTVSEFDMVHLLKVKRCLGYMDLRTGAIVWGHISLIFYFFAVLAYSFLLGEVESRYIYYNGDVAMQSRVAFLLNGIHKPNILPFIIFSIWIEVKYRSKVQIRAWNEELQFYLVSATTI